MESRLKRLSLAGDPKSSVDSTRSNLVRTQNKPTSQQQPTTTTYASTESRPHTSQSSYQNPPPSAGYSIWSHSSSSTSTRDTFRQLTHEILSSPLLQEASSGSKTSPSNKKERPLSLDPAKFDPTCSMEVPLVYDSHSSYSSTTDSNPSVGRQTIGEFMQGPNSKAYSYPADVSQYSRRLPVSKSEGNNVNFFDRSTHSDMVLQNTCYQYDNTPPGNPYEQLGNRCQSPDRGRGRQRTPSPVKVLEDLDEDSPIEFLHSPPKRSRSPHKKLFGENGWLGRNTSMNDQPVEKYKKPGFKMFGEKIKQRVEDITGDVMKNYPKPFHPKIAPQSTFPISLDPPTQARLYAEMELMICVSANQFLLEQHKQGRMSVESVSKVTSFWTSKNRPQVLQFQFDQATQRDLILYNLRTFKFHGECATNLVALNAILYNWKIVAKEMSVRTFCTPDSVVRKHMHDTHKILEMLGAPLVTFLAFQELQVNALASMKEEQEKRLRGSSSSHGVPVEYRPVSLAKHENPRRSTEKEV
ncbi:hypothetical protein AJ80_08406 [Polytolypa hystricis UAMH7299]|uniref:Uncharacterized protein n=1 Tax=Polytolypa hystricis (strain UAMH7299) TaxID=1447883 RepID=A0A2B7X8R4_POLH7|nr:hypothetical protein AJ80_08406 [Polytolypa hystricis UAMH7299]